MIEFDKRNILTTEAGGISEHGVSQIISYIVRINAQSDEWKSLNPTWTQPYVPALADGWQWEWIVRKGEYRGTFPKRVAQYLYKRYGLKCPPRMLEEIGNIARQNTLQSVTYEFDFTKNLTWNAGDFADRGSCYWWNDRQALTTLMDADAFAVRFWEGSSGIGRAWMVDRRDEEDVYVLWNGYGSSALGSNATLTIASVVAKFLDLAIQWVDVTDYGRTGGLIYINNGGYVLGDERHVHGMRRFDLQIGAYDYCTECDAPLSEDDMNYGADDRPYCNDCFYRLFEDCYRCGAVFYRASDGLKDVHPHDERWCSHCLDGHADQCAGCGEYFSNNYTLLEQVEGTEGQYCEGCRSGQAD